MGVLNVTPDSFSDGGRFPDPEAAAAAALRMAAEGASWIDVGGESSRPGAAPVSADVERGRVLPVLERLSGRLEIPLSIDTTKPEVARAALAMGASIVNDVTGFTNPAMRDLAAETNAVAVVMHMQGAPASMQTAPSYGDVVSEILEFLAAQTAALESAGVSRDKIYVDPGIGFGKTLAHNLAILSRIDTFAALGFPVVAGPSRKAFIGALTGRPVEDRLAGTLGAVAWMAAKGVSVVRVHDVREAVDCLKVFEALREEAAS